MCNRKAHLGLDRLLIPIIVLFTVNGGATENGRPEKDRPINRDMKKTDLKLQTQHVISEPSERQRGAGKQSNRRPLFSKQTEYNWRWSKC